MAYIQRMVPDALEDNHFSLQSMVGGLNNVDYTPKDHEAIFIKNMSFDDGDAMIKRNGTRHIDGEEYPEAVTFIDYYEPYNYEKDYAEVEKIDVLDYSSYDNVPSQEEVDAFVELGVSKGVSTFQVYMINGADLWVLFTTGSYITVEEDGFVSDGSLYSLSVNDVNTDVYRKIEFPRHTLVIFQEEFVVPFVEFLELLPGMLVTSTDNRLYVDGDEVATVSGQVSGTNFMGMYLFADGESLRAYGTFPQESGTYTEVIGTPIEDFTTMKVVNPGKDYIPLGKEHTRGVTCYDYTRKLIWYEPCENELDDPYAGANIIPNRTKYLINHNGRLYASGDELDDDNVFISDLSNPFYFPVSMPLQMNPNSDKVVGMVVYNDSVIVGRTRDIHAITGNSNNPELSDDVFRIRKLNTHTGFMSHNSFDIAHNYLLFLGGDGKCYALSSMYQGHQALLTRVISNQVDLYKEPLGFKREELESSVSAFFNDEWHVAIGDKRMVYSYKHRAWTVYYGIEARSFAILGNTLVWGNDDGKLVVFTDEYLDSGKPFEARITTKDFNMDSSIIYKYFREFYVVGHVYDKHPSDIRISFFVDYRRVHARNLLRNQKSRWGYSKWGDRFIHDNINYSYPIPIHLRGRFISFSFANGWDVQESVLLREDLNNVSGKVDEETLCYVRDEEAYYLYTEREWVKLSEFELNQAMKIYEITGAYTLRSTR